MPADRQRARDVIRYEWHGDTLRLYEHETITITDRAGVPGRREHTRVRLLDDDQATAVIRALLHLVPPQRRQGHGTFGINLFRTFTNIVTSPHRDNEEFVISYVLSKRGGGGETHLYQDHAELDSRLVLRHRLEVGGIIIFDDTLFDHSATPLEPSPEGTAVRDALVCTVDFRATYLGAP